MEKILENLQTLEGAINYVETEENANYVIGKQDKQLLTDTIELVEKYVVKTDVSVRSELLCDHDWVDATNVVIENGWYCSKCQSLKA